MKLNRTPRNPAASSRRSSESATSVGSRAIPDSRRAATRRRLRPRGCRQAMAGRLHDHAALQPESIVQCVKGFLRRIRLGHERAVGGVREARAGAEYVAVGIAGTRGKGRGHEGSFATGGTGRKGVVSISAMLFSYGTAELLYRHRGRCGKLQSRAVALDLAQPSLSRQIALLETDLGQRLLTRTGRGVTTTDAGAAPLVHARAMLDISRLARDELRDMDESPGGRIVVGMPPPRGLPSD